MNVIQSENVVFVDVDGTLVIHEKDATHSLKTVWIDDPGTKEAVRLGINAPMIKLVREEKYRGSKIIVWSRGGWEWAQNVVKALELEDCVDLVMSKPIVYFDDCPVESWLKNRVLLDPYSGYKGVV